MLLLLKKDPHTSCFLYNKSDDVDDMNDENAGCRGYTCCCCGCNRRRTKQEGAKLVEMGHEIFEITKPTVFNGPLVKFFFFALPAVGLTY